MALNALTNLLADKIATFYHDNFVVPRAHSAPQDSEESKLHELARLARNAFHPRYQHVNRDGERVFREHEEILRGGKEKLVNGGSLLSDSESHAGSGGLDSEKGLHATAFESSVSSSSSPGTTGNKINESDDGDGTNGSLLSNWGNLGSYADTRYKDAWGMVDKRV